MEINFKKALFRLRKRLLTTIMRTFIFLFCTTLFSFTPEAVLSQNAKIIIDTNKEVSVNEVFEIIKSQTDYKFIYRSDLFEDAPKVSLKKGVIRANKLLKQSLSFGDFSFSLSNDGSIILKKKEKTYPQQQITGTVSDDKGVPLAGVTIITKGTLTGTTSDFNGNFTLKASTNDVLVFSYLGFETLEIIVGSNIVINITLVEDVSELEEVVLIGYGTQKRSEVSSSISSIKKEAITNNTLGNSSFDAALGGLAKGVRVRQSTGKPGSSVEINVRGITSPFGGGNNNPLFVIDGVPFQTNPTFNLSDETRFAITGNPLLSINPDDIESVDVLKDAAATSIYGSRGANGVIIVKTRKGKKNQKMKISLSASSTFAKPINTLDYLNTAQYKAYNDELIRNSVVVSNQNPFIIDPSALLDYSGMANFTINPDNTLTYNGLNEDYFGNADTNWADEVYRSVALIQKYNLTASGGSEHTSYAVSGGYTNQEGLLLNEKFKQYSFRINLDSQINKIFKAGTSLNLSYTDNKSGFVDGGQNGDLNNFLAARPDTSPRDEFGNLNTIDGIYPFFPVFVTDGNPVAKLTEQEFFNKGLYIIGNTYLEAEVIENLKVKADINVSRNSSDNRSFTPSFVGLGVPSFGIVPNAQLTTSNVTNTNIITNLTASYNTSFDKHNIGGLLGYSWDRSRSTRTYLFLSRFPDDFVLTNVSSAERVGTKAGTEVETGLNSVFGRLTYAYDNKYFATVNLRTDRSSKFGPENQRGFFPSLAVSWNMAKESFFSDSDLVNNLRLRVGIGSTGSNNLADFNYLQFFGVPFRDELYNGSSAIGLTGGLPNAGIKWETTNEVNIGLDFGLFNNRLYGSIDVYNRKTKDAIMPGPYSLETGASSFIGNFASLTNKGFELEIGGDIIKAEDFTWSGSFNIAKNTNTLDKFESTGIDAFFEGRYQIGKEVNLIYGHVVEKIFNDQAELDALNAAAPNGQYQEFGTALGDYKYVDLNGDNVIDNEDRKVLGSQQADFFGGFSTSFNYKGLQLSAFFNYSKGVESTRVSDFSNLGGTPERNVEQIHNIEHRWSPSNPDAELPRIIFGGAFTGTPNNNTRLSNRLVYDASYVRLKSLRLGYTLPKTVTSHLGISNATIYVAGSNLWTLTDFPGVDPEATQPLTSGFGSFSVARNSDPYPLSKTWSLGINLNF